MINKLRNIIKMAVLNFMKDDSGQYQRGQASFDGKTSDVMIISPYGLYSQPEDNSLLLMFSNQAQESTKICLASAPTKRIMELKKGEVAIGSAKYQNFIKFLEDGSIEVYGDGPVTFKQDVVVDGSLTVSGVIESATNVVSDNSSYNDHFHIDSQGGNTTEPQN